MTKLKFHPLANLFPLLEGNAFEALVEDIKERGQQEPIWLFENMILDGRNRYRACERLSIEPKVQSYTGDDPIGFVLSANLHRRHLNEGQRAMVAAELANLERGANQHTTGLSVATVSEMFKVGTASVSRAKRILASGNQQVIDEVKAGEKSVTAADEELKQPEETKQSDTSDTERPAPTGKGKGSRKGGGGTKQLTPADADAKIREMWPVLDDVQKQNLLRHIIIDWVGWKRVSAYLSPEFEIVDRRPQAEAAE